jgi:antitoxin (DNA-binding transcriptional repressor) of toxin-antitoxin stability system
MDVSIAEAKNRLTELIRSVEQGEQVVITRRGKPVAQITAPPPKRRRVIFGGMKGKIKLYPGWDDPITEEEFFGHRLK